ncbi:DUF6776 family protein [Janthinobacterium sp. 17J80-10]|uniref:DUF6776 family protein n=1 Tax=Janthinobacterium sp. 17J80-10 TaxID=2497863 RepID=UPI001F50472B|nr:DUF6776 family protein [Janthinobacterium sp. 17J80-10]
MKNLFGPSLRLKLWRRRLSVAAPRVSIRHHLPWPLRLLLVAIVLGMAGAIALATYDLGRNLTGRGNTISPAQVSDLHERLAQATTERDRFSGGVDAAESQLQIERTAQQQMAAQVKNLLAENARLKEDLAFFERLLPASTGAAGISIQRLAVESIAPNQLKYRLLVMQGGKGGREFVGNLQLAVSVVREGKSAMIIFPDAKTGDGERFKLAFQHYQRMEGTLNLPEGAIVQTVQARILEKGQLRAQQSAKL